MPHSSGRHHNDHSNVDLKSARVYVGMLVLSLPQQLSVVHSVNEKLH